MVALAGRLTMSVLACRRRGCENIMCDRFSSEYGYLCDECFAELCKLPEGTRISRFMNRDTEPLRVTMRDTAEVEFPIT